MDSFELYGSTSFNGAEAIESIPIHQRIHFYLECLWWMAEFTSEQRRRTHSFQLTEGRNDIPQDSTKLPKVIEKIARHIKALFLAYQRKNEALAPSEHLLWNEVGALMAADAITYDELMIRFTYVFRNITHDREFYQSLGLDPDSNLT